MLSCEKIIILIDFIINNEIKKDLILFLINKYIEPKENYHINYSSLIFLVFILEIDLFLSIYCMIPYNTI